MLGEPNSGDGVGEGLARADEAGLRQKHVSFPVECGDLGAKARKGM